MPTRSQRKEQTRQKIVDAAARAVRRHGLDGISVDGIMDRVGLTHGGFYAHFDSKVSLLASAVEAAGAQTLDSLLVAAHDLAHGNTWSGLARTYLSPEHAKGIDLGCPIAALAGEIARQDGPLKEALSRRIDAFVEAIAAVIPPPDKGARRDKALAAAATLVGALLLARAMRTRESSSRVLEAAKKHLLAET